MRGWWPEKDLLQFYALSGGMRTVRISNIVRVQAASQKDRRLCALTLGQLAALK